MGRLLTERVERTRRARQAADPLTGFGRLLQKTGRLVAIATLAMQAVLVGGSVAILGFVAAGPLQAQSVREPIVPGVRPQPRPIPAPRITPRQPFAPAPRIQPGPRLPSAPGDVAPPGVMRPSTTGPNCHARCGSQCQSVSCSGLSVSQCNSVRQQCRLSCRSQCRS